MSDVNALVKEIYAIVNLLSEQKMESLSGDTLSRLAVKVASYKASLGEHVTTAKQVVWDADAAYKHAKAVAYKQYRDDGKGSTDAQEYKNLDAHEALLSLNSAKYQAELLTNLSMDCHDLIDSIKGRVINLQTERSESRV